MRFPMRARALLGTALAAGLIISALPAGADPNNNNSAKLRQAVTLAGVRQHQEAFHDIADEVDELLGGRAIVAVFACELGALLERGVERQEQIGGIASQPGEEEHGDEQSEQRHSAAHRPAGQIREHLFLTRRVASAGLT